MRAHGKINWTLEVLGKRPDGYHELRSIVLPIEEYDEVFVKPNDGGIKVVGCEGVPMEENLCYIAAKKLAEKIQMKDPQVTITVKKYLPMGGGLGGGSADAAITLRLLRDLWAVMLSEAEMIEVAASVGSDVPALYLGGPVMMEGRGEKVRRLTANERRGLPKPNQIVTYTPELAASTPKVYAEFKEEDRGLGRNDLQPAALRLYPEIGNALKKLQALNLEDVAMSGSGSTVYGILRKKLEDLWK